MQEYITCDLTKQNKVLELEYKWKQLKCLHLLEIYFGYLGTNNAYSIF
jgi:hypothetical protein